ncbi:polynucleotide 5'-hydroxyl-kinase NOL9-like [Mercenaria mercenaria]|uniref:polynucleotide 5'-hydroxyl-kinase NOL9-like n=1 Tax=Mercenaria mercenaria TaxID=6596 RepID=UPI00234F705F|nr:polynucleotide 5'-hydroxyl-kinase NOL9-like [Mercenaria mercenaria]
MSAKKKRLSAFEAKRLETDIEDKEVKTGDKQRSKKLKTKSEDIVIDLDFKQNEDHCPDLNRVEGNKKKKSKKGKRSAKTKSKSLDVVCEDEAKSKDNAVDFVKESDTIEILDDEIDASVVVEKVTDKLESGNKTKKTKPDTGTGKRDDKRKRYSFENDADIIANKKSKTDVNQDRQPQSYDPSFPKRDDELTSWSRMGSGRETGTGSLGNQQNEKELVDTDAGLSKSPTAIQVAESVLVIASHPCVYPLKGRVRVQGVVGVACIMGYNLEPRSQYCDVFSPDCNSLVTVTTVKGKTNTKKAISKVDSVLGITDGTLLKLLQNTLKNSKPFVILKFDKLETNICPFISSFNPYTNIFKVDGDRSDLNKQLLPLSVKMVKDSEVPRLSVPEQLKSVIDEWKEKITPQTDDQPVMLVCGGKDSGKSTTNRLLINSTLNILESVYYLECDIGQTEFTPPGVLSLVEVTSPVTGPPFTHLRKTVCSYHFGGVTPKDNPDLYMRCIQLCVQEYQHVRTKRPLIVNTMGWMKGLGWQLLLDIVRLVSPSVIVQLTSNQNSQNVPSLTVGALKDTSWTDLSQMYGGPVIPRRMERVPKILHLEIPVATSYNFRMKATDYRNLTVLSHLAHDLEPGLTLTSMTPYTVNWKDVAIHVCHVEVNRSQIMYALNANLVALCEGDITEAEKYSDEGPLFVSSTGPCRWIGYGLVRGIDMERNIFYIITSLTENDLARVNILDIGGISVPENFLTAQKFEKIPYVDEVVESVGLSAIRPRKHMPRRGLRGNIP